MARARLGMAFQDLRGGFNGQVLTRTRAGLATKSKPKYKYPKNADVQAGVERLMLANRAWSALNVTQATEWRNYAESVRLRDEVTGAIYSPSAKNAFVGLATKFLQMHPGGSVPVAPPSDSFIGDRLRLTAEAVSSGVEFLSPGANSSGTTTELLVQPLLNPRRAPTKFYKSAGFHVFPSASSFTVILAPGTYAVAYRFANLETGQATTLMPLGIVEVLPPLSTDTSDAE